MGQPVSVIESKSKAGGAVRYETNRMLTGTGHERYVAGQEILGNRPADVLARRIFERGGVDAVHVNGSVITIDPAKGSDTVGVKELIEDLYTYYRPGVAVPAFPTEDA
ncbi:MAG: hypothetical protein M9952_02900 [Microthrixaceae bacterium]|nr:hypothetical protein [Microthrixaceae bacterium]MCO5311865.1 hypothetical protein [Microthrixaceae bacterium]